MTHVTNSTLDRSPVVSALTGHVSDAAVIYQRLRAFHWMVRGSAFFQLHTFFEEQYDQWAQAIDDLAERVVALGGRPPLTLEQMHAGASLRESASVPGAKEMVRAYHSDLEQMRETLAATIALAEEEADRSTVNLLDGLRDNVEKTLWMLGAFLSEK